MDVGFIGLGAMGSRMAANLVKGGHTVTAWNRSPVKPPEGVTLAADPAAVGRAAGQSFVVVGGPQDVDDVVFGPTGWAQGAAEGSVCIQCTTIGPSAARSVAQRLSERGLRMIDGPVGGSTGPAAAGELVVLAGGDADAIDRVSPLLDAVSSKTVHFGGIGSGSAVKLMLNAVLLASLETAAEVWAWMADSEPDLAVEQVAAALERISPMVAGRLPQVAGDPPEPGFAIRHAAKDVRLAVAEAGTGTVLRALLDACGAAEESGLGDVDIAGLGQAARLRRC
ncbi:MAG: NAD(P)-dependent oxidoreductase [Actinomycetota bacterium]|nr:NAD(P)-dependent oxidoreductase [Actinomycetota bacterium]